MTPRVQDKAMLLNPEQEMIRDSVREFAREQLAPNAVRWDRDASGIQRLLIGSAIAGE